jgi:hypothetical protein
MRDSAWIVVKDDAVELRFEWTHFDGDDCFEDFQIIVSDRAQTQRFEFGGCVISGLRELSRFFGDKREPSVSGGFRNPDIRTYDLYRDDDRYRLAIRFEGVGLAQEFHTRNPVVQFDRAFLNEYDGVN